MAGGSLVSDGCIYVGIVLKEYGVRVYGGQRHCFLNQDILKILATGSLSSLLSSHGGKLRDDRALPPLEEAENRQDEIPK